MKRTKSVVDYQELLSSLRREADKKFNSVNEKIEKGKEKIDSLNKDIEEISV